VLADLPEREPQYRALAKRVAVRGSAGRVARRSETKARSGARSRAGESATSLAEPDLDDAEYADDAPPADELTTTSSRVPGNTAAPGGRSTPGTARPGPRQQQPRRSGSSARHRPAGKKKRR
jgi:hypothetical protein